MTDAICRMLETTAKYWNLPGVKYRLEITQ